MNIIIQRMGILAIAMAVALPAVTALASTPDFSLAAPIEGQAVDMFRQQIQTYNSNDIADLLKAKTVQVVKFDTAWRDSGDAQKAFDAVSKSDQSIHLLREGLKANPEAAKLLAENKVVLDTVIDIVPSANGTVQLYVQ